MTRLADVLGILQATRFCWASEDDLQRGLAGAFDRAGIEYEREARLDAQSRPDFLVGRVAVEVKVRGAWRDVLRQVQRYGACDQVDAVVVVTSQALHRRISGAAEQAGGKPIVVHCVGSVV